MDRFKAVKRQPAHALHNNLTDPATIEPGKLLANSHIVQIALPVLALNITEVARDCAFNFQPRQLFGNFAFPAFGFQAFDQGRPFTLCRVERFNGNVLIDFCNLLA